MNRLSTIITICVLAFASSARADWVELGAAYKCVAGRSFELRATVDTSNPEDPGTIRPAAGFTALKQDELTRISCNVIGAKVEGAIRVWRPRATGACAGRGEVTIESLLVNGKQISPVWPFNMSCPTGPAVVSVRVEGSEVKVCQGEWGWGEGYHNVKCISAGT